MLKVIYLINRVSNVYGHRLYNLWYGWLIICVTSSYMSAGLYITVLVKRVSSSLNYVTLFKQLFKASLCSYGIVLYRAVTL